jgi:hypothetical protein
MKPRTVLAGGIDRHQDRGGGDHGDRREISLGIVGQLRVNARIDHVTGRHQQQRVAVGRRLRDDCRADCAASAAAIVDHDWLAHAFVELLPEHAPYYVGAAARRIRHD